LRRQAEPEIDKSEVDDADRAIEKAERQFRTAVDEVGRVEHLPLSAAQRAKLSSGVSAQTRRLSAVQTISLSLESREWGRLSAGVGFQPCPHYPGGGDGMELSWKCLAKHWLCQPADFRSVPPVGSGMCRRQFVRRSPSCAQPQRANGLRHAE
jgi:hypothetical protein